MELDDSALFRQQCYIGGQWVSHPDVLTVYNPADTTTVGHIPCLQHEDIEGAIGGAGVAFQSWSAQTAKERSIILKKWQALILQHKSDLATIISLEQGKPYAQAEAEIVSGAGYIEWFAEEAKRVYGDTIPMAQKGKRIIVLKQPIGVCAAVTPWNFPSSMIARKVAPALAAGCTIIVKPSELTPFSALALAELAHRAGFPPGVMNVVTGDPQTICHTLTSSDAVRKLSFTGSTSVGKSLMRNCSDSVKNISLELGGHAPFIVFADASVDAAIVGAMESKFRNSGQTCVCTNRFFIHRSLYEQFADRLTTVIKNELRVGPGFDPKANIGPLINEEAVRKVEEHVTDAVDKGARVLLGGKRVQSQGFFFEPTVLGDVTTDMKISREETFGPVAPLLVFDDEEEVVTMANDSRYGLASYCYTNDIARAWRLTETLEYGMVGINTGLLSSEAAPFGGIKQSGIGREGSKYGIEEFLEKKYMCLGGVE